MKSIIARATLVAVCICLLAGFTVTRLHAGEYYIYQDSMGGLVISNKEPPPGSKIIKQKTLPDLADAESPQVQEGVESPPNGKTPNSNPSTNK